MCHIFVLWLCVPFFAKYQKERKTKATQLILLSVFTNVLYIEHNHCITHTGRLLREWRACCNTFHLMPLIVLHKVTEWILESVLDSIVLEVILFSFFFFLLSDRAQGGRIIQVVLGCLPSFANLPVFASVCDVH